MLRTQVLIPFSFCFLAACHGTRPDNIGIMDGHLTPCPPKPNCVSTSSTDGEHNIAPFPLQKGPADSLDRLRKIIKDQPRTTMVTDANGYMHVEFESLIMRFVDDVEFFLPAGGKQIEARSASRLGHSDLGVNRKRMEELRRSYEASAAEK